MEKTKFKLLISLGFLLFFSTRLCAGQEVASSDQGRLQLVKAELDLYDQNKEQSSSVGHAAPESLSKKPVKEVLSKVKISGAIRAAIGLESDGHAFFTRANADLNERNYRLLTDKQLNNFSNTYDPAVYSRIKVVVDALIQDAVGMHLNVTVDPWSFTGKTANTTVTSNWGDQADVQYLFWGNTGYTVNQNYVTSRFGDSFAMPEIKVKKNRVPATIVNGSWTDNWGGAHRFSIPEMKIDYTFQPVRELWFDLKPTDILSMRVFPIAYQDQALSSDDPLKLSNNKTYWEESPWLRQWSAGNLNAGVTPNVYTQGYWDRSLAFFTRDSDGQRLTALRGVSMKFTPNSDTTLDAVIASPKTLWQEYSEATAVPGSVRLKHFFDDDMYLGGLLNMHQGLVNGKQDAENYVESVDGGIILMDGVKALAQVSTSQSHNDMLTPFYDTKKSGQAYYASIEASPDKNQILQRDYYSLQRTMGQKTFYKTKLYFARMDKNFESSLANYHETRDDAFWSRHLTFYPSLYRDMPGNEPTTSEADQMPFAIGNGIDQGREAVGLRGDVVLDDGRLNGMGDVRRVRTTDGKYVETVARTAWTHKTTNKLTTKALILHHNLPNTHGGVDPFITDGNTGENVLNDAVPDGKDPSLTTGTLGARYEVTDWAVLTGVWEHTNDFTVAADNFPQGVYNSAYSSQYWDGARKFYKNQPLVYSQQYFDQAPYEFHNILKYGLLFKPTDVWNIYIDYTRNPNRFAGNIDDNMNHFGLETSYVPNKLLGFFARYTFSKWNDINTLLNGHELQYRSYNNLFLEARYLPLKDNKFTLQYGVGPAYTVDTSLSNPQLAYYAAPVLTTEHVVRMIYERKF
jgi:hypothetical protein